MPIYMAIGEYVCRTLVEVETLKHKWQNGGLLRIMSYNINMFTLGEAQIVK